MKLHETNSNLTTTVINTNDRPEPSLEEVEAMRRECEEARAKYPEEITRASEQSRPLLKWEGLGYYLNNPAPRPKLLFYGKGWEIPDKCAIALFAAGASGKTFLGLQLAACLATGINLEPFITTRPLMPAQKKKVLYIFGEDSQDHIHGRIESIVKYMPGLAERRNELEANLTLAPLVGQEKILIAFDQNRNPATTKNFDWLSLSIEQMPQVDVLVIDPLSKFYGLNENDNAHAAAWIAALETLAVKHDMAILFIHHESKDQNRRGELRNSAGRGAGAFRDNVRGALSMAKMDSDKAKSHNYPEDWQKLVEVLPTKANYVEEAGQSAWFKRGPGGVLMPTDIVKAQNDNFSALLFDLLKQAVQGQLLNKHGEPAFCNRDGLTLRGLTRGRGSEAEEAIREEMKDAGLKNLKNDINRLLLRLETENKITIDRSPEGGRSNKQKITVFGYQLTSENESGDQAENRPTTPDLIEGGVCKNTHPVQKTTKVSTKTSAIRNQNRKREKKSPGRKK